MRATIGNGGWVALDDVALPGRLYIRFGSADYAGRLRITEFYLDASENRETSIIESDIRDLPLAAIEAVINDEMADAVRRRIDIPSPDLATLASYYVTTFGNYSRQIEGRNWVVISFASQVSDEERRRAGLPKISAAPKHGRDVDVREIDPEFRLDQSARPSDGLTNQFLELVARAYRAAMLRGERPNVAISKQLNYPLKTVQRWVYTARQRGIMGPGSKGRPG